MYFAFLSWLIESISVNCVKYNKTQIMKFKSLTLILAVGLLAGFNSCKKKGCTDPNSLAYNAEAKKDDGSCTYPTSEKKALVFKKTATWCPYCGDWGGTYSTNISNDHSNVQVIQMHGDNDFGTSVGDQIMDALPSAGWPHFYVGTADSPNSYNTLSNMVSTELAETNEVAMAMESSVSGSSMEVRVQSQWQSTASTSGEYYLAVYILEDGQVATQDIIGQPSDPNYVHNNVSRAEASNAPFGKAITVNTDGCHESFNVTMDSSWESANCYPVAVLWKKNGSNYDFVNLVVNK